MIEFPNHPKHVAEWLTPYALFAAEKAPGFIADLAKAFSDDKTAQKSAYRALTAIGPAGVVVDGRTLAVRELDRKTESKYEKTKILEWRDAPPRTDNALEARLAAIEARLDAIEKCLLV